MGRLLAIGDVHGCLNALQTLDHELAFGPDDKIIALGDYVDRGPNSKGVIEFMIQLRARAQLVALRGNHEIMMLQARGGIEAALAWLSVGGEATMASYNAKNLSDIPLSHWQFFEATQAIYETKSHFFVHANVVPSLPLSEQGPNVYWQRFWGDEPPHCSNKIMVCGHSSQRSGVPLNIGHAVCIDTWVYGEGWLTCLDVESGNYWQGNQKNQFREGKLKPA